MTPQPTKSDFTLARSCPRKLLYKKAGYSSNISDNEYIEFLADAGFAIGKMAQLMYPDGITINSKGRLEEALEETKHLLQKQAVVLFEASYFILQLAALPRHSQAIQANYLNS